MESLGLSSTFIMPDYVLRSHPFVAVSFLNPHRDDEEEEEIGISTLDPDLEITEPNGGVLSTK